MLGRISKLRHAVVVAAVGGTTALTGIGVIGGGDHPERIEHWQTIIEPAGAGGLRITETFDHDFGSQDRRGPQRLIPNDYGAVTDVTASSPDAPDQLSVVDLGAETRVRIGDPDVTISGQHRYTLAYTLPVADLEDGFLAIDVLDGDELETGSAEVVVRGFDLDQARCFVGGAGSTERCDLVESGGVYRATFGELPPFTGITIDGYVTATIAPVDVPVPALPERRDPNLLPLTLGVGALGTAGAGGVYRWLRRTGRNEVYAGGAADAAYGTLPPPNASGGPAVTPATQLLADDELGELATIEFVPPKGIQPWEAAVLLTERIGDETVEAWLSGLAGRQAIELEPSADDLSIRRGPAFGELDQQQSSLLAALMGGKEAYVTGTYDPAFAAAWRQIVSSHRQRISTSGWWKRMAPGGGLGGIRSSANPGAAIAVLAVFGLVWFGSAASAVTGLLGSWPLALLAGLVFPSVVAFFVYRLLLPARTAQGSALALQAESFRRFLHASEGQHVEWAWSKGLLREYSGWAVALGEADAWSRALEAANVPAPARAAAGPIIVAGRGSSIRSSRTAPSQSGSGGGGGRTGGFSGGRVGGGGGGGSRGSW
jgi:uncharacterized membrane protein YgcG